MMDKWADGDLTGANDEFFAMMNKRADDMLYVRKQKSFLRFSMIQKCKMG